jgi:hypothetical protein
MKRVLLILLAACAPETTPPETFSIDADFPEPVAETIRDAVDAWCDAVGWCPEETSDTTARGRFVFSEATVKASDQGDVAGFNDGWRIVLIPGERSLDMVWSNVAHEIGHWCSRQGGTDGQGHTADGLLAAVQHEPHMEIDPGAVRAWRDGCELR